MDDLLDEVCGLEVSTPVVSDDPRTREQRNRLATLAAGGQTHAYLGRNYTTEEIDSASDDEITTLHARYEAKLGAAMVKTIGRTCLQVYTNLAGSVLPIPESQRAQLLHDLEADPIISHALSNAACMLYHKYGAWLAPASIALTTMWHCQKSPRIEATRLAENIEPQYGGGYDIDPSAIRSAASDADGDTTSSDDAEKGP